MNVDRPSRDAAIAAIEAFRDGRTTNREFDDTLSVLARDSTDPSLRAVARALWTTYDDLATHTATGLYRLTPSELALIDEWLQRLAQGSGVT